MKIHLVSIRRKDLAKKPSELTGERVGEEPDLREQTKEDTLRITDKEEVT